MKKTISLTFSLMYVAKAKAAMSAYSMADVISQP